MQSLVLDAGASHQQGKARRKGRRTWSGTCKSLSSSQASASAENTMLSSCMQLAQVLEKLKEGSEGVRVAYVWDAVLC